MVGCTQGLTSFNLLADKAHCPMCREAVQPATCAFMGCAWMYDGRKSGPDGQLECCSSDWQVRASGNVRLHARLSMSSMWPPIPLTRGQD